MADPTAPATLTVIGPGRERFKMNKIHADVYVANHPGARIEGEPGEPPAEEVEAAAPQMAEADEESEPRSSRGRK
jgi:hypothetical protein